MEARNGATFENLVDAVDTLVKYAANDKALSGVSSSLQAEICLLYTSSELFVSAMVVGKSSSGRVYFLPILQEVAKLPIRMAASMM